VDKAGIAGGHERLAFAQNTGIVVYKNN